MPLPSGASLPRSLSALETWGFGLTGLLLWLGVAPGMQAELGAQSLWVWLPGVIIGMLMNRQVKRLGWARTHMAGGTPNYITQLFSDRPWIARYAALGYLVSWVAVLPVSAILLTGLIQSNLQSLGIEASALALKVGFTLIGFVVAFSGTRALGILHLMFVVPAVLLLLLFCVQGIGWLAIAPDSPGLLISRAAAAQPDLLLSPSQPLGERLLQPVMNWAKWYILATYAVYACETASSFVADSQRPKRTLRVLPIAASLMPIVYVAGSWVLIRLDAAVSRPDAFTQLVAASPFWGQHASVLVTFLIASGCLLACATAVSNCPRILYQLAQDGYLPPVFAATSRQGVLGPGLLLTLLLSLLCLAWGDVHRIVMITGIGWLIAFICFHWGLWRQRYRPEVWLPWGSLGFAVLEAIALVLGGIAWGWQDWLVGITLPIFIWGLCHLTARLPLPLFRPDWWIQRDSREVKGDQRNIVVVQVGGLIVLLCGAIATSWGVRSLLEGAPAPVSADVLVVLLLSVAFVGVAIACWTTLPQVAALADAREQAEQFFNIATDSILVLNQAGLICRANAATAELFKVSLKTLTGHCLTEFMPQVPACPSQWPQRCEYAIVCPDGTVRMVEVVISGQSLAAMALLPVDDDFDEAADQRSPTPCSDFAIDTLFDLSMASGWGMLRRSVIQPGAKDEKTYVAILRDITERKRAEAERQRSEDALREKATELQELLDRLTRTQSQLVQAEKMSSLGQLVAGVAHEINNPVNFIHGNLIHARHYVDDLLKLVQIYQVHSLNPTPESLGRIQAQCEDMDLDFVQADLPKLLASVQVGADRILEIIRSLRTFSRHDEAEFKSADLHAGIDSTLMILRNRIKTNPKLPNIEIVRDYGTLPKVDCYAGQLNQVFMNLLGNAIDALEDNADLWQQQSDRSDTDGNQNYCRSVEPSENSLAPTRTRRSPLLRIQTEVLEGDRICIRIIDNGPGIPASCQARLFDPFFTTKPVGKGTGLGLAISYQVVVEKHQGKLRCQSEPGVGTEFCIEIPIHQQAAPTPVSHNKI